MKTALIAIVAAIALTTMSACSTVEAKDKPLWKTAAVFNAAGPYCLNNNGVYNVRPNIDGNYWITCSDGTMIRAKIKVEKPKN